MGIRREAAGGALKAPGTAGDRHELYNMSHVRSVSRLSTPDRHSVDHVAVRGNELDNPAAKRVSQVYLRCVSEGKSTKVRRRTRAPSIDQQGRKLDHTGVTSIECPFERNIIRLGENSGRR